MQRVPLGSTGLSVPSVVLGLMRIGDKTDDEIRTLVGTARAAGIDFFDHAPVYGGDAAGVLRHEGCRRGAGPGEMPGVGAEGQDR